MGNIYVTLLDSSGVCRHEGYKKVNSRQESNPQYFGNVSSFLMVAPCSGCTRFQYQFQDNSKTNSIQAGQCQCEFLTVPLRTKDRRAAPPTISRQEGLTAGFRLLPATLGQPKQATAMALPTLLSRFLGLSSSQLTAQEGG